MWFSVRNRSMSKHAAVKCEIWWIKRKTSEWLICMLTTRWTAGSNFDYVKLNIFEEKNRGPSLSRQRQTFSLFLFWHWKASQSLSLKASNSNEHHKCKRKFRPKIKLSYKNQLSQLSGQFRNFIANELKQTLAQLYGGIIHMYGSFYDENTQPKIRKVFVHPRTVTPLLAKWNDEPLLLIRTVFVCHCHSKLLKIVWILLLFVTDGWFILQL